jgi:hypothetical protein
MAPSAPNQSRAKSLGVGRNQMSKAPQSDVKGSCAPSKPLGSNRDSGMGGSGLFIPRTNCYAGEKPAHLGLDDPL